MITRSTTVVAMVAAAALTATGGLAVAQAAAKQPKAAHQAAKHTPRSQASEATGPDTDGIQSGDQITPDAASAAQTAPTETSGQSTETAGNDGPGGHEDEPGAEADHQFEGEE